MTISPPTPETISIMNTLSGSTRIERPKLRLPADSQVQAVETCARSLGSCDSMTANETTAAANESATEPVAMTPAARRESWLPPSTITATAASGRNRQIQAVVISVIVG